MKKHKNSWVFIWSDWWFLLWSHSLLFRSLHCWVGWLWWVGWLCLVCLVGNVVSWIAWQQYKSGKHCPILLSFEWQWYRHWAPTDLHTIGLLVSPCSARGRWINGPLNCLWIKWAGFSSNLFMIFVSYLLLIRTKRSPAFPWFLHSLLR